MLLGLTEATKTPPPPPAPPSMVIPSWVSGDFSMSMSLITPRLCEEIKLVTFFFFTVGYV